MAEYIEREALLNRIAAHIKQITPIEENRDRFYHDSGRNGAITGAILDVQNLPAADVAPVVHGRWEEADDGDGVVCSVCREDFCNIYLEVDRFKYCPNCGAKMDAEA